MEMAALSMLKADIEHWVLNGIQVRTKHTHSQTSTETHQLTASFKHPSIIINIYNNINIIIKAG